VSDDRIITAIQWLLKTILANGRNPIPVQDAVDGLLDAGFELEEIDAAVDLLVALPNLIQPEGGLCCEFDPDSQGMRVLTAEEKVKLPLEAQEWLWRLLRAGLISRAEAEYVLQHAMALDIGEVGVPELKWVIAQILEDEARALLLATTPTKAELKRAWEAGLIN
jgi:uncharacterized protein Smg (DUF494 family)